MTFTLTAIASNARHAEEVRKLAIAFSSNLAHDLGADTMMKVKRENLTLVEGCCASHDFCDANIVMFESMIEVVGRKRARDENDAFEALWGDAWNLAKKLQFDTDLIAMCPL